MFFANIHTHTHTRSKDETKLSRSMLCISDFSGPNYWNCVSRQNIKLGVNIAVGWLTKWKKGADSFGSNYSGLYCSHGFEMNIMLKLYFVYIFFLYNFFPLVYQVQMYCSDGTCYQWINMYVHCDDDDAGVVHQLFLTHTQTHSLWHWLLKFVDSQYCQHFTPYSFSHQGYSGKLAIYIAIIPLQTHKFKLKKETFLLVDASLLSFSLHSFSLRSFAFSLFVFRLPIFRQSN